MDDIKQIFGLLQWQSYLHANSFVSLPLLVGLVLLASDTFAVRLRVFWVFLLKFSLIIHRYLTASKAVIYYFLPLSIIGILYALMARRLHLSAREMPGELVSGTLGSRSCTDLTHVEVNYTVKLFTY